MQNFQSYVNGVADFFLEKSDYDKLHSARPFVPTVEVVSGKFYFAGRWDEFRYVITLNELASKKRKLSSKLILAHETGHWFFGEYETEFYLDLDARTLFGKVLSEIYADAVSFVVCDKYAFFDSNYKQLLRPQNIFHKQPELFLINSISKLESTLIQVSDMEIDEYSKSLVSEAMEDIDSAIQIYAVSIAKDIYKDMTDSKLRLEPLLSKIKKHPLAKELRKQDTNYVKNCLLTYAEDVILSKYNLY